MGINIREQHTLAMKKLRNLFPKNAKISYVNGMNFDVPCTISKPDVNNISYDKFVGKNIVFINILIDDLKKVKAPIKDFLYVTIDRTEYQVESSIVNGIFNDSIQLQCKIYKSGNT